MLTVDDYGAIRRARRDGMSIRQIARQFGHSRKTVRHVLNHGEPRPGPHTRNRAAPVLGPFQAVIDRILADDEQAPPSNATPPCRSSVASKTSTATAAAMARSNAMCSGTNADIKRPSFLWAIPRAGGSRPTSATSTSTSPTADGPCRSWSPPGPTPTPPFVLALPFERTEAILAGMVAAFEFFGCIPKEVWWDNPKTVATAILQGRQRLLHPRYAALASHYAFEPLFCMPARGNEKPDAESTVKAVQRRFATPVPRVADLAELNASFHRRCQAERERIVHSLSGAFKIGDRFAEEQAMAAPLPATGFDACVTRPAAPVDKYQTVAFDGNRYSTPRPFAFRTVTVKGYVDRVVIVADGQAIASHERSLRRGATVLDPIHYLATLGRRPAALDHAPVYRDWACPVASPRSAPSWKLTTAARPAHGGSYGSSSSWASIPWTGCAAPWRPVSSIRRSAPRRSSSGRAAWPRSSREPAPLRWRPPTPGGRLKSTYPGPI